MKQCPYCLKEISEFAIECPHCGKKLNVSDIDYSVILSKNQEIREDKQKYKKEQRAEKLRKVGISMGKFGLMVVALSFAFVFFSLIYSKIQMPKAKQYLEEGEYEKAYNILYILKNMPKNDAAQELLTEIRNESYILSAREATIERIKNDDNGDFFLQDEEWNYQLEESTFFDYRLERFDITKGDEDFAYPVIVLKILVHNKENNMIYGEYYSFCAYMPSMDKYASWGICPYASVDSDYYDAGHDAGSVNEACRNISGYEPQNKPLKSKFDGVRLSNMIYSDKKINILK